MKKLFLYGFLILTKVTSFSQVQIGSDIDGIALYDNCGVTVSMSSDGSVVAIGAAGPQVMGGAPRGAVRVFRKLQNAWVQIGNDLNGLMSGDGFGYSIDVSDDGAILAVGAYGSENQIGNVTVFQNISDNWIQLGNIISGESLAEYSGIAISLSSTGFVIAIGAHSNSTSDALKGCVRVYQYNNDTWTKIGNDIYGESIYDYSGSSVLLSSDGTIVAIGAPYNNGIGFDSGQVRVYQNIDNNWIQIGNDINGEAANDQSGAFISLSADGTIIAIGSSRNSNTLGVGVGHVRVYKNISNVWTQIGSDINGVYKVSLSANGQILATGSPNSVDNGSAGTAKVFKNISNNWLQIGNSIVGENPGDYSTSGMSLSSDGAVIAIGAPNNNGNGIYSGHVRVYDLASILTTNTFVKSDFAIIPNPTKNYFELITELTIEKVEVYSMLGQLVKTFEAQNQYSISELSKGSYIVKIATTEGVSNKTLLKE